MPGPGPHTAYALGTGLGMMRLSRGRFSPQRCLFYAVNVFLGPDLALFFPMTSCKLQRMSFDVKPGKSLASKSAKSMWLVLLVMLLYCLWCSSQIYWRDPPLPAVGEEADLGVIVFLALYFFLAHTLLPVHEF